MLNEADDKAWNTRFPGILHAVAVQVKPGAVAQPSHGAYPDIRCKPLFSHAQDEFIRAPLVTGSPGSFGGDDTGP